MPLYFIENCGRLDPSVAFSVQGRDTTLYFAPDGVTIVRSSRAHGGGVERASLGRDVHPPLSASSIRLAFVEANPAPRVRAADPTPAVVSWFEGPRKDWKTGLTTYGSIVYEELWPGIDLVFSGTADRLKSTFVVRPGADPSRIRLAYRGARGTSVNARGELEVATAAAPLVDEAPYAYQETGGGRVEVAARYRLEGGRTRHSRPYGFSLGAWDRTRPLVIDPALVVYCGYVGGSVADQAASIHTRTVS